MSDTRSQIGDAPANAEAVERARYFIDEVWPRIANLGDPYRGLKTLALSMAHDVLRLAGE